MPSEVKLRKTKKTDKDSPKKSEVAEGSPKKEKKRLNIYSLKYMLFYIMSTILRANSL